MDIVERLRMKIPMSFQMDWSDRAKAAGEIERLREALQHILTHCKSDKPPNAQALILFVNNTLKEESK